MKKYDNEVCRNCDFRLRCLTGICKCEVWMVFIDDLGFIKDQTDESQLVGLGFFVEYDHPDFTRIIPLEDFNPKGLMWVRRW